MTPNFTKPCKVCGELVSADNRRGYREDDGSETIVCVPCAYRTYARDESGRVVPYRAK